MKAKFFYFLLILSLISCRQSDRLITYFQQVTLVNYKNNEFNHLGNFEDLFKGNMIYFSPDKKVSLSRLNIEYLENLTDGEWHLIYKDGLIDSLHIKSYNYVFENTYKVKFLMKENDYRVFMHLDSNKLEIYLASTFKSFKDANHFINHYNLEPEKLPDNFYPLTERFTVKKKNELEDYPWIKQK